MPGSGDESLQSLIFEDDTLYVHVNLPATQDTIIVAVDPADGHIKATHSLQPFLPGKTITACASFGWTTCATLLVSCVQTNWTDASNGTSGTLYEMVAADEVGRVNWRLPTRGLFDPASSASDDWILYQTDYLDDNNNLKNVTAGIDPNGHVLFEQELNHYAGVVFVNDVAVMTSGDLLGNANRFDTLTRSAVVSHHTLTSPGGDFGSQEPMSWGGNLYFWSSGSLYRLR